MRNLLFCFFLLTTVTCTSSVEKPDDLLSQDEISAILVDIYIHQQGSYLNEIKEKDLNHSKVDALILKKHNTTDTIFESSYRYYVLNPEKYLEILEDVRDNLESELPEKEQTERAEKRKKSDKKK